MFKHRISLLGGLFTGALAVVGCGSSTPTPRQDGGSGGATGTGGAPADGGAGRDGGDSGSGGAPADGGADVADSQADASDARMDVSGPCVTDFGAGNPVQYAFNGGANLGWYQFVSPQGADLTTSLGASFTDGHSCPGALQLGVNFTAYGSNPNAQAVAGSAETYFGAPPNGRNWTAYKSLHAWIKVMTADYQQIAGVYFYVKSGNAMKYQSAPVPSSQDLSDGRFRELVVDLTNPGTGPFNGVTPSDVQLMGFQVLLNMAPPAGAPATPSQVILLMDDIWLEALPPSDAGTDGGGEGGAEAGADAPADTPAGG